MSDGSAQQVISLATQQATVQVSRRQQGNPILKHVTLVKWEFCDNLLPDYVCGTTMVVFVTIKFHLLKGAYVKRRIEELGKLGRLRVLLVHADDADPVGTTKALLEINKLCFENNFTCLLGWSDAECARYIESLKAYEKRGVSAIQEKVETEFLPRAQKVFSAVKSLNKTDVSMLLDTFGSFAAVCRADAVQMQLLPGLGEKKVRRLHAALNAPFRRYPVSAAGAGGGGGGVSAGAGGVGAGVGTGFGAGVGAVFGAPRPAPAPLPPPPPPPPQRSGPSTDQVYGGASGAMNIASSSFSSSSSSSSSASTAAKAGEGKGKGTGTGLADTDIRDGTISAATLARFAAAGTGSGSGSSSGSGSGSGTGTGTGTGLTPAKKKTALAINMMPLT